MDSNRTSRNYMAPVVRTAERSRTSSQHATATKNYKPQFIIKILNWESTKSVRGADTWLSIVNSGASSTASCQPAATTILIIGSTDLCNIQAGDHLRAEPATVTDQSANQLSLVHTLTMMIQFHWTYLSAQYARRPPTTPRVTSHCTRTSLLPQTVVLNKTLQTSANWYNDRLFYNRFAYLSIIVRLTIMKVA